MDGARNLPDEFGTNFAIFGTHWEAVEQGAGGVGNVQIFGHAAPRRLTRLLNSSELQLHALPNGQHRAQ
jgi:hypothetical protein